MTTKVKFAPRDAFHVLAVRVATCIAMLNC